MEEAERRRQAQLEAQARARLEAAAAARAGRGSRRSRSTPTPSRRLGRGDDDRPPPAKYGGVVGIAMQYLGVHTSGAARARRASTARARLVRLRADRRLAPAQRGDAVQHRRRLRLPRPAPPGDLVFFDGLGPHGHVHRRRPVHPRAAHGRRRQDLEPQRLLVRVDLRRREAPDLQGGSPRPARRPQDASALRGAQRRRLGDAFVQLFDLVGEVLEDDAALELERRRHLALLHLEVAREDHEPLELLEARPLAVDVVDDRPGRARRRAGPGRASPTSPRCPARRPTCRSRPGRG